MHPALSVIVFTSVSGIGYGLAFMLSLSLLLQGGAASDSRFGFLLASILIGVGLLASLGHLGNPQRAWRALSQWRSSWLSREGVCACLTFAPIGVILLAAFSVYSLPGAETLAPALTMLGAAGTVYCTAMIYRSLKPIRQWFNGFVAPLYLLFATMSGALLWLALLRAGLLGSADSSTILVASISAVALILITWISKYAYWQMIDKQAPISNINTATGLAGEVKVFDPPHTEENYLMQEMGFVIGRKHGVKLRRLALVLGVAIPVLGVALAQVAGGWPGVLLCFIALASQVVAIVTERWLFFAQAQHTVALYYGH